MALLRKLSLANEAIQESLKFLQALKNQGNTKETQQLLAQALEVKGTLQLDVEQSVKALETWQQTANYYQEFDI